MHRKTPGSSQAVLSFTLAGLLTLANVSLLSGSALAATPAAAAPAAANSVDATAAVEEGTLEILVEDHAIFSRTRHFLKTGKGTLELQFKGAAPSTRAGAKLRIRGQRSGDVMALSTTDSTSMTVTAPAPMPNTLGEQKVAVLLINFTDDRSRPYTLAQANDVVFNQVNGYVKENAFDKTWLSGGTFGWLELPIAKTCNGMMINSYARQAAANAGVDLAAYGRFVYVFPENPACGWAGSANLAGTLPSIWINGWLTLGVVGHELGHTFGLEHAHSLDCGAATIGGACTRYEYGDTIDIMGNRVTGHFSAFNKERLGWLNQPTQPAIAAAQASGRYTIEAYAAVPSGLPKALKVPRGTDPVTGAALWYYIEYRQPVGYDLTLASFTNANFLRGLVVRGASEGDGDSGVQLDVTPNSSTYDDWADAALAFGQAYTDPATGVTIVALAGDGRSAQLDVTLGAVAACTRAAPQLTLSGGASGVAAGTAVGYALTVINKDGPGCGASAFDLGASVPVGWRSSFNVARSSLDPGAMASIIWTVTSAPGAAAGSFGLRATATNAGAIQFSGSAAANQTISTAALATSVTTDKGGYRLGDSVSASASVMSGAVPLPGATVGFVFTRPDGSSVAKSATTDAGGVARTSYRLSRKDPIGAWQLKGSASFTGLSGSASSAFSVQ